jgi:hypothetical protein
MTTARREAEPEHKLHVYRNLGLRLTYLGHTNGAGRHRSCRAPLGFGWCPRPDVLSPYTRFVHTHQCRRIRPAPGARNCGERT